jgi:hypothetical protein
MSDCGLLAKASYQRHGGALWMSLFGYSPPVLSAAP